MNKGVLRRWRPTPFEAKLASRDFGAAFHFHRLKITTPTASKYVTFTTAGRLGGVGCGGLAGTVPP